MGITESILKRHDCTLTVCGWEMGGKTLADNRPNNCIVQLAELAMSAD